MPIEAIQIIRQPRQNGLETLGKIAYVSSWLVEKLMLCSLAAGRFWGGAMRLCGPIVDRYNRQIREAYSFLIS
jgi:hypothetical protein